jgi:hypothetical protein
MDAAVDMALRCEMDDSTGAMRGQQVLDSRPVTDVALDENMARVTYQRGKILQITGIGELVEIDNGFVRLSQPVEHKVTADKTGATGNE